MWYEINFNIFYLNYVLGEVWFFYDNNCLNNMGKWNGVIVFWFFRIVN